MGKAMTTSQREEAKMITELVTCSHDFIYIVTTLFAQLLLYLLGTHV
jgi:hypothetical protein